MAIRVTADRATGLTPAIETSNVPTLERPNPFLFIFAGLKCEPDQKLELISLNDVTERNA